MSPKLRPLSGREVIDFCTRHDLKIISTKGSHVNLARVSSAQHQFVTTVPLHKEIDRGTLHTIYKRLVQFIAEAELRPFFYTGDR